MLVLRNGADILPFLWRPWELAYLCNGIESCFYLQQLWALPFVCAVAMFGMRNDSSNERHVVCGMFIFLCAARAAWVGSMFCVATAVYTGKTTFFKAKSELTLPLSTPPSVETKLEQIDTETKTPPCWRTF